MRALLIALVVAASGLLASGPARAHDNEDFLRWSHQQCERGDRDACRIHHLYEECDHGDRRACDEINRERYHEHWQSREHEHGRDDFLRHTRELCERGDREACHIHHLYEECDHGDRRACDEIARERYHEHYQGH